MYKLFAMDIDDTLIHTGQKVSQANRDAIRRIRDAGVYVILATGRSFASARRIFSQLEMSDLIINYGGAAITDIQTGQNVFFSAVDPKLVTEVLDLARDMNVHAHIYQGNKVISETRSEWVRRYTDVLSLQLVIDPDIRNKSWDGVPKVLVITEKEDAVALIPVLQKRFHGRLNVSGSVAGFIEFNNIGADKGSSVKRVADRRIRQSEVAAIGDNTLDMEMIRWAGLGAAVANANPEILQIADVVTPPCDEDGVAWLIDRCLLKGR